MRRYLLSTILCEKKGGKGHSSETIRKNLVTGTRMCCSSDRRLCLQPHRFLLASYSSGENIFLGKIVSAGGGGMFRPHSGLGAFSLLYVIAHVTPHRG